MQKKNRNVIALTAKILQQKNLPKNTAIFGEKWKKKLFLNLRFPPQLKIYWKHPKKSSFFAKKNFL